MTPKWKFDFWIHFTKNINFLESEITSSQNKRLVHSEKRKDWDKIFENVKIENSDRLLFENKDSIENENKPVQFLENFIFKQLGEKLLIFNHKNCQQRILFEKYQKNSLNNYSNTQQSLFPQYVEFNSSDFKIIEEILEDIRSIGFSIDIFGKNSVVINGIPSGLDDINEKEIVEGFVEEVKNNNLDLKSQKKELILKICQKY